MTLAPANGPSSPITVAPREIVLAGRDSQQQLLVTLQRENRFIDATRDVKFRSLTPDVISVSAGGIVSAKKTGKGKVEIVHVDGRVEVDVQVTNAEHDLLIDFQRDIVPIFTRKGCNAGACHGKASGQNGFKLSLLGFDVQFDYDALMKEARGRRLFQPAPDDSLLLTKPIGLAPHGGGRRIDPDSREFQLLRRWIVSGMARRQPKTARLIRVSVEPSDRIMSNRTQQQLLITAHYEDGSNRDVTRLADFQSNESAIAEVDENGLVNAGTITGEAAVMARYMGLIAVSRIAVPLAGDVAEQLYADLPRYNFIDEHVWNQLRRLGITPSTACPDHAYLRRTYIDIIGRVPTADEARAFLKDPAQDRREVLVDHLLEQPDYVDHWANKWADLLRPNPYRVGLKAVLNYDAWIRDAFRKNKPYDEFVRDLLTAKGSTYRNGAVTYFRDRRSPDELATITSQLFLGIRLECAKCHHHPFEKWAQKDFYSFAAYFARIGRKGRGLSPPISGSEEIFFAQPTGTVKHPLTGEVLPPMPLFGEAPAIDADGDLRESLAGWITSDDNPFFSQVMVNRVWADMMGRGLVEPVDDLRATNPPTNGPLLEALAVDFRNQNYDIKKLIRRIATSYVYRLSSIPGQRNVVDTRNYSRHYRQRLRAEVLLDSVSQITLVPEKFDAMPAGSRAKEIWTHRIGSLFLDAFGRPDPNQDPPCERVSDTTVVQALHLMNSENLYRKVTSDSGRAAKLAKTDRPANELVEELYLHVYSRFPTSDEVDVGLAYLKKTGGDRRQVTEDLMWALMNTPEFVFKN